MIIKDDRENELLEIISVEEEIADTEYAPINHCLAVVKASSDYLLGWNRYRQNWEIFGECREQNETLTECINRECNEELGLKNMEYINKHRTDKEEVVKLAFYSDLKGKEKIAPIDEKLLEYWDN